MGQTIALDPVEQPEVTPDLRRQVFFRRVAFDRLGTTKE
jgi:hypothetical protein